MLPTKLRDFIFLFLVMSMEIGLITYPIERSPAGVGTYTYNLVKNVLNIDSNNNYYLLHYEKNADPIYSKNEILYKYYRLLPVMFSDSWYLFKNQILLV